MPPSSFTRSRWGAALGLLLLLIPSAWFAWRERDLPHFGVNFDDGIYFVSAKSLADGGDYRIVSLPEQPSQTKQPPLFPLYLSLAWRINPHFPDNLPIAAFLAWLTIPAYLVLNWRLFRLRGFGGARLWVLLALLAVNPYVIRFGVSLFSEMFFGCLAVASILLLERRKPRAASAGVLAGLSYLARTAGLALLISAPLVFLWRGKKKHALLFAAVAWPAFLGWTLWTRAHKFPSPDDLMLLYTSYLGYHFHAISLSDYPVMLWKNIDGLLYGMGAMFLPQVGGGLFVKILTEVAAIAMISGVVRLVRRGVAVHFAAFAAVSSLMLIVWHYPPNERFVLPLAPLLLVGFVSEMEHLIGMLRAGFRHQDRSQRVVARGMAGAVAALLIGGVVLQLATVGVFMPAVEEAQRQTNAEHRAAYQWISANLPPGAGVVSYLDTVTYLHTGHPSLTPVLPTKYWYREDHAAIVAYYAGVAGLARAHHANYLYFTSADLSREIGDEDKAAVLKAIAQDPNLTLIHRTGIGGIYRVEHPAEPQAQVQSAATVR